MSDKNIVAAIDLGSSKTTTLVASANKEDEGVKIVGVANFPSRGLRKGQIVDIEEATQSVIESVESAERMAGYRLNKVIVSVGGPHLSSQNSTGVVAVAQSEGEIDKEDVARVIEAARAVSLPSQREILHVIPRNFTVDGQGGIKDPVGMSGVRLEVETHLITGSSTAIRNLTKCVNEIGAGIESLVASGIAASDSVLTDTERELGVILLDIGGGVTNIIIFIEGAPFYTSVLPIGAKNVTNDLAIGLRVSLETAEKIKLALSNEEKPVPDEDEIALADLGINGEVKSVSRRTLIEGIIKPRLSEIFSMVQLEIQKSGAGGLTPAGIVVCGGGARTIGVVEAAKRSLAMPVRIGFPTGVSGLIDDIKTPEYAVATGLILSGLKKEIKTASSFKFPKIPVKGMAGKAWDLLKSFLP